MHRYGHAGEARASHRGVVQRLDCEVDGGGREPRPLQERPGPRQAERLMAQLVTRHEQHGAAFAQGRPDRRCRHRQEC